MEARYVLWISVFFTAALLDISKVNSREFRRRTYEGKERKRTTHWIRNVKHLPKDGDLLKDLLRNTAPDGSKNIRDESQNKWIRFKENILRRSDMGKVQFVKISRKDALEAQRSYAVLQPTQPQGPVQTVILSMAAVVMFVVVLVICIHAPCTCLWRRRHRSELEVDLISCPNPTAHDGKCGKCIYDRVARKSASSSKFGFSKSKRPFSSPASIATIANEELYMPCDNQSPWISSSNKGNSATLPNPKKSRSIVQAILKRSRDRDKFRYEFLANRYGYNYKQFRDSYKRSSIYDEQDPNWYSPGEFLNNQSSYRGQKNYGSTDAGKHRGTTTCCQWSRGHQQSTNQSVEDIIKLQPRRRQVVELQEFPVGYSGTIVGVDGNGKENILFDPLHDAQPCYHGSGAGGRTRSESNMDLYFSRRDNNNHVSNTDPEKTYQKSQPSPSPKTSTTNSIVQNFPVQFDYDTKFVQQDHEHLEQGKKKSGKVKGKDSDDDDSDLYETSDDDLLSFDEWDAALERRQRRSQEFLYSPHMQGEKQQCPHLNHSYPAVLRYPDIPRDTRSLPREYKNRMRGNVTRSETELRRHSGYYGQNPVYHGYPRGTSYHSSSDTSLHRMQIEKELAAAGLNKEKKKKEPRVTIRDNRLDPLAGIMSPMRPLPETSKQAKNDTEQTKKKHWYLSNEDKQSPVATECNHGGKWEPDLEVCLQDERDHGYVVKLPSLDCKESVLHEQSEDEGSHQENNYKLEKELNNEKPGTNYNRVHLEFDPHYIKNSYLREEPVRDTDSDEGERSRSTEITTGKSSIDKDEKFSSNRSTRL